MSTIPGDDVDVGHSLWYKMKYHFYIFLFVFKMWPSLFLVFCVFSEQTEYSWFNTIQTVGPTDKSLVKARIQSYHVLHSKQPGSGPFPFPNLTTGSEKINTSYYNSIILFYLISGIFTLVRLKYVKTDHSTSKIETQIQIVLPRTKLPFCAALFIKEIRETAKQNYHDQQYKVVKFYW